MFTVINGVPHGGHRGTATCSLTCATSKMARPSLSSLARQSVSIIKDLVVAAAWDRIIQAGGFVSVNTGGAPEANGLPVPKEAAELSMDAAACIGCGACVAVCKNASAMLFVAAKVSHLNYLPQGSAEKHMRALNMVAQMDAEGFGKHRHWLLQAVCPKEINLNFIAKLTRDYGLATLRVR